MITRLYANNFRCLVAFEAKFESFGLLCGPNGSGKSSVFDALRLIRSLATGEAALGGEGIKDVPKLEFTNWLDSKVQEFELSLSGEGHVFDYKLKIEQKADFEKPRIVAESATCDGRNLFERDLEGVRFPKKEGAPAGFPLDWRQSVLAVFQPKNPKTELALLQKAISSLLILRPNPRSMEQESRSEARHPEFSLTNLTSWYRSLSGEQEWMDSLRDSLRDVWHDFKSFRLVDVGLNTKALQLKFEGSRNSPDDKNGGLFFEQLSDGERALIALYMIRAALDTGAVQTVLIDEPDNFIGLPELQPWVLTMRELLDPNRQAILISHHPELLSNAGEDFGRYLWRDSHTSPTRIGPLKIPPGIGAAEAVARGWAHG